MCIEDFTWLKRRYSISVNNNNNNCAIDPSVTVLCCVLTLLQLPFKHESLLIDSVNERMTELEKYQALTGFQAELRALKNGPASIHEFRAMQAKSAPLPRCVCVCVWVGVWVCAYQGGAHYAFLTL